MKYGMGNYPVHPVEDEARRIKEFGFDYLELNTDAPYTDAESLSAQKEVLLGTLRTHNLELPVIHLPTFVFMAHLEAPIRRASVEVTLAALRLAEDLGVRKAVLHPAYFTGLGKTIEDMSRRLAEESLDAIVSEAARRGVTICLENMFPQTGYLVEAAEFEPALRKYRDLMLTLDIGHANIDAGKNRSFAFIDRFADRIGHVHVSDNNGRRDEHLPWGKGNAPLARIFKALKAAGYEGTMTLEVFTENKYELRTSLRKARESWASS